MVTVTPWGPTELGCNGREHLCGSPRAGCEEPPRFLMVTGQTSSCCAVAAVPILLCRDRKFKQYVELYAKDEDTFFKVRLDTDLTANTRGGGGRSVFRCVHIWQGRGGVHVKDDDTFFTVRFDTDRGGSHTEPPAVWSCGAARWVPYISTQ